MDFIGLALDIPQTKTPLELFSELAEEATVSELVQSDLRDAKTAKMRLLRTGKEIRFRFGSSEDKAGKESQHQKRNAQRSAFLVLD